MRCSLLRRESRTIDTAPVGSIDPVEAVGGLGKNIIAGSAGRGVGWLSRLVGPWIPRVSGLRVGEDRGRGRSVLVGIYFGEVSMGGRSQACRYLLTLVKGGTSGMRVVIGCRRIPPDARVGKIIVRAWECRALGLLLLVVGGARGHCEVRPRLG